MLSNFGHGVESMSADDENDQYIDAAFERLVRGVKSSLAEARRAVADAVPALEMMRYFKELCRMVRRAKIDFRRVVRFYGATYQDCATPFVELVHEAFALSAKVDYPEVYKALQRHADEVDAVQAGMKAAA